MNYSNEQSLKDTFGDAEVAGLLQESPGSLSPARLEKASYTATDEINNALRSAGYIVPVEFTPYGIDVVAPMPPHLPGQLQMVADAFTAFHLAASTDLNKKKYEDLRAEGLKWLEQVRIAEILVGLPGTVSLTGAGIAVAGTRPQVFVDSAMRERDIFNRSWPWSNP